MNISVTKIYWLLIAYMSSMVIVGVIGLVINSDVLGLTSLVGLVGSYVFWSLAASYGRRKTGAPGQENDQD